MLELDITPKQQEHMKVISIGCIANSIVNGLNIKEMDRIKLISLEIEKDFLQIFKDEIRDFEGVVLVIASLEEKAGMQAAQTVSSIAKEAGNLTIGIVIKPFYFDNSKHISYTEKDANDLKKNVDTLITLPNDRSIKNINKNLNELEALKRYNNLLKESIKEIITLITMPINSNTILNIKYSDLRTVIADKGTGCIKTFRTSKITEAIKIVTQDANIKNAMYLLINITIPESLGFLGVDDFLEGINNLISSKQEFIYNLIIDNNFDNNIIITLLATDFE